MTSVAIDQAATLFVRTAALPDIPHLLTLLPAEGGLAWVHGRAGDQVGLIGLGEVARITISGPERFSRAQRWWSQQCAISDGGNPVAFASFAFDKQPGTSVVVVPKIAIQRSNGKTELTVISESPIADAEIARITAQFNRPHSVVHGFGTVTYGEGSRPVADWQTAVDSAVTRINSGELDKVVLARDIIAQLDEPLHIGALLIRLNEEFPECWTFSVDGLVGATPELLVRLSKSLITSRILAGTIRKTGDDERDLALAGSLASSSKDLEEHEYAVRSVAEALEPFCSSTNVPESPFVLHLANVMHLATDVTGALTESKQRVDAFSLLKSLHPSAAVCGTPRNIAFDIIDEIEGMNRGRYAGPVGWIDASGDGELGIALRTGQISGKEIHIYAGCGIVAGSNPEKELEESNAKMIPMRSALQS